MGDNSRNDRDEERELSSLVALLSGERRRRAVEALRSFFREGDAVQQSKQKLRGRWRRAAKQRARELGVKPSWLDEAARAAFVFRGTERESLLRKCETSATVIKWSHLTVIARALPAIRRRAVELLCAEAFSVEELRQALVKLRRTSQGVKSDDTSCTATPSGASDKSRPVSSDG